MDLTGQVFGRLTVRARAQRDPSGRARWHCECVCGAKTVADQYLLRSGRTKSCGCWQREKARLAQLRFRQGRPKQCRLDWDEML